MSETRNLSLAEKVEGLTGPCRETDAQVFRAIGAPLPSSFAGLGISLTWQPDGSATMPVGDMQVRYDPPAYTASVDAVVALIEKELPGRAWAIIGAFSNGKPAGFISEDAGPIDLLKATSAIGNTPALALLAAFLRAKAQEQDHG